MTCKPLSHRAPLLLLVASLVGSVVSAQPGGRQDQGQGPDDGLGQGPLPMKKFLIRAERQYDSAIRRAQKLKDHPEIALEIQKTKKAFDDNKSKYLKTPPYQPWEVDYIKDTVNNHINEVRKMIITVQDASKEGKSAAQIQSLVADLKVETQANQIQIDKASRAAALMVAAPIAGDHAAGERGLGDHMGPNGPDQGARRPQGSLDDNEGDNAWENHKGKDFDSSEVVRLQQYAMQVAGENGGGSAPSHGGGGGNSSGGVNGGGHSSGGASSASGAGAGAGSFNDKIGDLTQSAAAQALTTAGADALNAGHFSDALASAQSALALDPNNQAAMMILHSAQGRVEGGGSGLSAGGSAAGGERGFAGGEAGGEGGRASFGAAAHGPAMLTPSSGASRLTSEQALKDARNAMNLGDKDAALAAANRLVGLNPADPSALALRAKIYAQMGDYARAIADAKAGLEKSPKDRALLQTLGYAQLRNKDYNDALASANSLIEMDPKDAYAYALRGHAFGSLGDRDAMMSDLKHAVALDTRYQASLDRAQLPSDSDILFLFPGEAARGAAATAAAAPSGGRIRNFGFVAGAAAFGGLLLAIGLLRTVLAPLKEQVSSVFTRLTRTGPSVASMADAGTPQPASVNGLMPGLIRGQYEITRQIGQGGMGTVYEGTDKSLGRRVAIKKMREELRVNPAERARFVIEAKTVAALHHPNVVDIYAIAEDGQDVFLVFEFVDGKTVHDLVQRAGRLSIAEAARITRASADALTYAHARGVIHRDMKPSNVMVDGQGRIKVMDFGIARMAKDSATRYSMTNTVVGTPPYMAPEQEQGQVRKESDVYALGICAYEMLTGKLPFIGIGAGMLMNKINMSYVPPSRAIAGLPDALDEVFAKAFQADPDKRYRTPAEFADALEAALPSGVRA